MSSPAQAPQPENATVRQPDELLYDFEAVLRLVDHAIADLSEHDPSPEQSEAVDPSIDGDREPT